MIASTRKNPSGQLFDPWTDAAQLAQAITAPGALLVLVIGAQTWCQKCRDFYPVFCNEAKQAQGHALYCWLDMEEHEEFLGGFIPENLPWLCLYQDQQILASCEIKPDGLAGQIEDAVLQRANEVVEPGILARLVKADWAVD